MNSIFEVIIVNAAVFVLSLGTALGIGRLVLSSVSQLSFRVNHMTPNKNLGTDTEF